MTFLIMNDGGVMNSSTKPTHGGARKGAGKKPHGKSKKVKVGYSIDPEVHEFLKNHPLPAAELIETAVRKCYMSHENP